MKHVVIEEQIRPNHLEHFDGLLADLHPPRLEDLHAAEILKERGERARKGVGSDTFGKHPRSLPLVNRSVYESGTPERKIGLS